MPAHRAAAIRAMIAENVSMVPVTGCWMWMRHISPQGYGMVTWGPWRIRYGDSRMAHRLSLEADLGFYIVGGVVDHLCEHKWCVNPAHLLVTTHSENVRRSIDHRRALDARLERERDSGNRIATLPRSPHMIF